MTLPGYVALLNCALVVSAIIAAITLVLVVWNESR